MPCVLGLRQGSVSIGGLQYADRGRRGENGSAKSARSAGEGIPESITCIKRYTTCAFENDTRCARRIPPIVEARGCASPRLDELQTTSAVTRRSRAFPKQMQAWTYTDPAWNSTGPGLDLNKSRIGPAPGLAGPVQVQPGHAQLQARQAPVQACLCVGPGRCRTGTDMTCADPSGPALVHGWTCASPQLDMRKPGYDLWRWSKAGPVQLQPWNYANPKMDMRRSNPKPAQALGGTCTGPTLLAQAQGWTSWSHPGPAQARGSTCPGPTLGIHKPRAGPAQVES